MKCLANFQGLDVHSRKSTNKCSKVSKQAVTIEAMLYLPASPLRLRCLPPHVFAQKISSPSFFPACFGFLPGCIMQMIRPIWRLHEELQDAWGRIQGGCKAFRHGHKINTSSSQVEHWRRQCPACRLVNSCSYLPPLSHPPPSSLWL